LLHYFKGSLL